MTGTESTPVWVADEEVEKCSSCKAVFSLLKRRHHCRKCGLIFCADCSSNKLQLPKYGYGNPVRVCDNCYQDQTQVVIGG